MEYEVILKFNAETGCRRDARENYNSLLYDPQTHHGALDRGVDNFLYVTGTGTRFSMISAPPRRTVSALIIEPHLS